MRSHGTQWTGEEVTVTWQKEGLNPASPTFKERFSILISLSKHPLISSNFWMTSGHLTFVAPILLFRISLSHISSYGDIFQRANCCQSHICPWFRSHPYLVPHYALLLGLPPPPTNFSFPSDMPHISSHTFWFSFPPPLPPPDPLNLSWWLFSFLLYLKHSLNMLHHTPLGVFSF